MPRALGVLDLHGDKTIAELCYFNTLTPKPAVTSHATSILVGRISASCCSERREKAVGRVVIEGTLKEKAYHSYLRGNVADESIPQTN
ncbi:hypothetical protein AVEN_127385-1 [Araneus ventricosus]|uniref:Uncharacterized protein n=1 Tax=Araneus ventricosus TaxID=182803 RepID=A0A4Y2EU48_ARAVE|nr:hypothetical protein AVEN_127385-1 [Araneus ventricosus]